jgi:hypothetical protein
MLKKIVSIILCLVLAGGVFAGCTLFERDTRAEFAQVVATIEGRTVERTVEDKIIRRVLENGEPNEYLTEEAIAGFRQNKIREREAALRQANPTWGLSQINAWFAGTEGEAFLKGLEDEIESFYLVYTYTYPKKHITKAELVQEFNQRAQEYLQQGMSIEEALDQSLTNLVERELLMSEIRMLLATGQMPAPRQTSINELRRSVYSQIDGEIFNQVEEIVRAFRIEEPPHRVQEGTNPTPPHPVRPEPPVDPNDVPDDIDADGNRIYWQPEAVTFPENQGTHDLLFLEGLRRFMNLMFSIIDDQTHLLTEAQLELLEADKERWETVRRRPPSELAGVYETLLGNCHEGTDGYFAVWYFFYRSAFDNILLQNLERMVKDTVTVSNNEVVAAYNSVRAQNMNVQTREEYISMLEDDVDSIVFHKFDVQQFYVKHILIPFSDAQTALFEADGTKTQRQLNEIRNKEAFNISAFARRDGFEYGVSRSLASIENEIYSAMNPLAGFSWEAEQEFERLIFRFNTDQGIFNNARGYGVRFDEPTSFVPEFEAGAMDLYRFYLDEEARLLRLRNGTLRSDDSRAIRNRAIGSLNSRENRVVTQFGVHIMMLSSVIKGGHLNAINDFTNVMRTTTFEEVFREQIQTMRENEAYQVFQSDFMRRVNTQRKDDVVRQDRLFRSIVRDAERA